MRCNVPPIDSFCILCKIYFWKGRRPVLNSASHQERVSCKRLDLSLSRGFCKLSLPPHLGKCGVTCLWIHVPHGNRVLVLVYLSIAKPTVLLHNIKINCFDCSQLLETGFMMSPAVKTQNGQQRALLCIALCPLLIVFAYFVKINFWKARRLVLNSARAKYEFPVKD